jgi:hypothetical protein
MGSTRRTFALSLGVSALAVWVYFGLPPWTGLFASMDDGSVLNWLAKMLAIPLTLAIIAGAGLAAANALSSGGDVAADRDEERRRLALTAAPGSVWVAFVAAMAFPLGPVGNALVVAVAVLAVMRMLQNAVAAGVFRSSPEPDPVGRSRNPAPGAGSAT